MRASESSVREENVLIDAGACSLTILPQYGGKIASLQFHGQELLQTPLVPIAPRTAGMPFDAADASGWDECLPSVAACTVNAPAGPTNVPDHGDLWRVPWTVTDRDARSITLTGSCFSLPLQLARKLSLAETANGVTLRLDYKLINTGDKSIPWSWAAHPLFTAALGDRIVFPDSVHTLRLEGSGGNRLGSNGDEKQWPIAEQTDGSKTDLSWVAAPDSGIGDKLFAGPMNSDAGWCALERPSAGLRIKVGFDPNATPYIGLWICYGGWPERPGPKQVCVALEPSTAPVDSLAATGPWSRILAPGESAVWPMHVHLETL
ncbi:MAG TPA: aldose epimerase [Terracidiphilus sp.]|nr:aldose epimerase [Terracidiphilus sp.]